MNEMIDLQHPGENRFNWLAHRQLDTALAQLAQAHASGRLVDIGCGLKPYRSLFAPHVAEHVGVDHPESPHARTSVDVLADAYDIPLEDESFDTALMSEVLEHLERPRDALAEARRLLRPGGKLILTAPLFWVLHEEPRDFYRYTPHALRYLMADAGFSETAVEPLSGQWSTLALMGSYALQRTRLVRAPAVTGRFTKAAQQVALRLDRRNRHAWMSWSHTVVATR